MLEILIALAIFVSLVAASLGGLVLSERLPAQHRQDETYNVVRLAANIFVVLTSLVLGLLVNSSKNTFEAIDRNIHAFSTELILFDRTLRHYGPDAAEVRQRLRAYVRQAIKGTWGVDGSPVLEDRAAEALLEEVGNGLMAIRPSDPLRTEMWRDAEVNYQNVVRRRWALIEESEGKIPTPFLVMVVAWLVLIFASFGYRAPRNAVVVATGCVSNLDCGVHLPDARYGCTIFRADQGFACSLAAGGRTTAQVTLPSGTYNWQTFAGIGGDAFQGDPRDVEGSDGASG